jgi:hypothetical protein
MNSSIRVVPTTGEIARRFGVPIHCVRYVIDTRGVEPAGKAGNAYFYAEVDVERIASELRHIRAEREGER